MKKWYNFETSFVTLANDLSAFLKRRGIYYERSHSRKRTLTTNCRARTGTAHIRIANMPRAKCCLN